MNRRLGAERSFGICGGIVSERSRKNLEKAEDLCQKRKPMQALPYLEAAIGESPDNLDAVIQLALLLERPHAISTLERAELKGRSALRMMLGDDCFEDGGKYVGSFWGFLETRPYMRVLQALVRLNFEEGRFEASAKTIIEMLRLCPGDNMSQRTWLGSILIRIGRSSDALSFAQTWLLPSVQVDGNAPHRGGTAFQKPTKEMMPSDQEKSLLKWGPGAILYTAALASFKLWGDCPESRQYLTCASKTNPNILLKVLGSIKRPKNLNMDPHTSNGPEDARDYLWLTQDLWMESDVWKWANENPDVRNAVLKSCSREGCSIKEERVAQFKRCAACHLVSYCGPTCQKGDWAEHKPDCRAHKAQKAALRAFPTG